MLLDFLIFVFLIQVSNGSHDADWFRNEMTIKVVTRYKTAYNMLNDGIIQSILNFNMSFDELEIVGIEDDYEQNGNPETYRKNQLTTLVDQLDAAANSVYTNLKDASSECERLRVQLNEQITSSMLNVSQQEEMLRQLDTNINQLEENIRYEEQEVAFAEKLVRERQANVDNAEREYQNAEDRVDDARLCREKRFIGGWWREKIEKPFVNAIQTVVVKPFCSVANRKGIHTAKDIRTEVGQMLNDARQRLHNQQQELNKRRGQLSDAQTRRNAVQQQRDASSRELVNLRTKYAMISSLTEQFLKIFSHVASVVGSADVLNKEIKRLMDFELVIEPLNVLARQMTQNGLMSSFGFEISASTIANFNRILDQTNEKLSTLPLIIHSITFDEQIHHVMLTIPQAVAIERKTSYRSPGVPLNLTTTWTQTPTTVAGGSLRANLLSRLSQPQGFYVDDDQSIIVADTSNHRIVQWKRDATHGQIIINQLNRPTDVIFDPTDNTLIICDQGNKRVMRWSRYNGTNGEILISNIFCHGLALDNRRYLYVTDINQHYVKRWKLEKNGTREDKIVAGGLGGGGLVDQLNGPTHVFVDQHYSVFVSDRNNHRVMKWVEGAIEGVVVAGGHGHGNELKKLTYPNGIIVDQMENVYVVDSGNQRVMRWTKGANEGEVVIHRDAKMGSFNVDSLCFDRYGNIYVSNLALNVVQKYQNYVKEPFE